MVTRPGRNRYLHVKPSHGSRHLWTIIKLPELEKQYRIYILPGSGQPTALTIAPTYESWQFERPIDFLNWLEEQLEHTPHLGGLR
jgi:hypothetical protein